MDTERGKFGVTVVIIANVAGEAGITEPHVCQMLYTNYLI